MEEEPKKEPFELRVYDDDELEQELKKKSLIKPVLRRDIFITCSILSALILFSIFIYPTLYKYEKLDQKTPVKINRITGSTELLTSNGWVSVDDPSNTEMENLRSELFAVLQRDRETLQAEVIDKIKADLDTVKSEVTQNIKSDIDKAKLEVELYKQSELDLNNYFGIGSTMNEVKNIMGAPDQTSRTDFFNQDIWYYGSSSVTFVNGKVKEYSNSQFGKKLRIK